MIVIYDKKDNSVSILVDSFTDHEIGVNFFVVDNGRELDGLMDFEYFNENCEVLGWL